MKQTAIIYCRKSTDREDRQQNSLDHQLINCRNTAEKNNLAVLDEIKESISAKVWNKRSWFNRMIQECSKSRVDYIIIDETKRLSRNIVDSALIIWLLDNNKIKWIITTDKRFEATDISWKFMLLLELWISKMDNEYRSKDVKDKMITALNNWKLLSKAPFWYKNIWKKWNKDVIVIEEEARLVRKAFIMRSEWKWMSYIAKYLSDKGTRKWSTWGISYMLKNSVYYWYQSFWWREALIDMTSFRPIVSRDLFNRANWIRKKTEYKAREWLAKYFDGIIRDPDGKKLSCYQKKSHVYYRTIPQSKYTVNINEQKLFDYVWTIIKDYDFPKPFVKLSKATLKEYYKDKIKNRANELRQNTTSINKYEEQKESLIDKFLDNDIDKEVYKKKKDELDEKLKELKEEKESIKQWDNNVLKLIESLCELVESLSASYLRWNDDKKGKIIRAMQFELFINNKKELTIKESNLFKLIKCFKNPNWYTRQGSNPR